MYLFFVCCCWLIALGKASEGNEDDRPRLNLVNFAGAPIDMFWLSEGGDEVMINNNPLINGSSAITNCVTGHKFAIRFASDRFNRTTGAVPKKSGIAEAKFRKSAHHEVATVTSFQSKLGFVKNQLTVQMSPVNRKHEMLEYKNGKSQYVPPMGIRAFSPKSRINHAIRECEDFKDGGELFSQCVMDVAIDDLLELQRNVDMINDGRERMGSRLRNYTCADETLSTSPPLRTDTLHFDDGTSHEVDIFLDLPHAKIWTVQNMISDEECDILIKAIGPELLRATVADDYGAAVVSESRKAQQAQYKGADHQGFGVTDPLFPLFRRILNVTNEVAHYQLQPEGQEGLMLIQYNVDDQYSPHCDGDCAGSAHRLGGRVASSVLYCEVPKRGGATTFTKADIFIRPTKGMATFFSYKGADGFMDLQHTEHSGCPVLEGEKWITTAWMREGVDGYMDHEHYDPQGNIIIKDEFYEPTFG